VRNRTRRSPDVIVSGPQAARQGLQMGQGRGGPVELLTLALWRLPETLSGRSRALGRLQRFSANGLLEKPGTIRGRRSSAWFSAAYPDRAGASDFKPRRLGLHRATIAAPCTPACPIPSVAAGRGRVPHQDDRRLVEAPMLALTPSATAVCTEPRPSKVSRLRDGLQ